VGVATLYLVLLHSPRKGVPRQQALFLAPALQLNFLIRIIVAYSGLPPGFRGFCSAPVLTTPV
jgi:hypothetical protein